MEDSNNDYQYEEYYVDSNPAEDQVREYARFIGIDPDKDSDLLYIAAEGLSAPLPKGWKLYRNKNNADEYFFFNSETGESINDHPLDQYYTNLAKTKLEEKYAKASKKEKNKGKSRHKKREKNINNSPTAEEANPFLIDDDDGTITSEEPPTFVQKANTPTNINSSPITEVVDVEDSNKKSKSGTHSKHKSKSHSSNHYNYPVDDTEAHQISEKNDEQIKLLQEEFENKKADLEREHQKIINDLKLKQNNELQQEENVLKEIQDRRKLRENELHNIDSEMSLTKDQQKSQIDILKSNHDQFMETLKQQNNDDINHLKESFENTKKQLQDEQNNSIEELKKKNESELNQIKKSHEKEKNELLSKFKDEIADLKKQHKSKIEKMRAKHERQLSEIRSKAANHLETERKKFESQNQQKNTINNLSPKSPMSISSNFSTPQNHQKRPDIDYQKESIDTINKFNEYTKNELDKKRREYEIQLSKLMTSQSEEIAKKQAENIQLLNQLENIKHKYNEEIRRAQENAENEKRNIMKQMQKDVSSARKKELKEKKRSFICQTQRIVSIRGKDSNRPNRKIKLKPSKSYFLSIIDEINLKYSPPHTVFQIYCKTTHHSLQKDKSQVFDNLENDNDFPSNQNRKDNEDYSSKQNKNISPNANTYVEISENEHQKLKYSFQKIQQQFDSNAKKIENRMDTVLSDINGQMKELKSFMQEESRAMNKNTLEFHQQILDITRNFHNSLSELETEHYSAFSTMNSIKNKAENIPQPTQIIVAPPLSPQPFYSYISPEYQQNQRYRRPRRYNVREAESYYDSDYD